MARHTRSVCNEDVWCRVVSGLVRRPKYPYRETTYREVRPREMNMDYEKDKVDEATLALLYLVMWKERDRHLGLDDGEYDLDGLLKPIAGQDKHITLETPRTTLQDDVDNLNILQGYLG